MHNMKKLIISLLVIATLAMAWYLIKSYKEEAIYRNPAFSSGNGRLEATEINIAAKLAGKIEQVLVDEGDYVKAGQTLVQMQTNTLVAELEQANAQIKVKEAELEQAKAQVEVEEASLAAAKSSLAAAVSTMNNAKSRYDRSKELLEKDVTSRQTFENDEALYQSACADVDTANANIKSVEAAIDSDKAAILAAKADADRIQADIDDSTLTAPIDGRIQYRIAEPGEVLSSGGRVLNLVDLTDVYLTFFVPEETAGKIALGADARIVLDAMDDVAIPASISYVASVAQFTPKSVETRVEREKLMFRVKAKIDPALLKQYVEYVKTGIPGVAWVRLDDQEPWPDFLKTPKEKGEPIPAANAAPADKPAEANETAAK